MEKVNVNGVSISIIKKNEQDYISLTDMLKAKGSDFFIDSWLRNRNTLEFLSIWESINNPSFNYVEFDVIKSKAGLNSFKISVKEWVSKTNSIGLEAKTGRYGGTYAHKDIAFEFGTWISPEFKFYLIKEFQRLKEAESKQLSQEWDYRRFLSKVNYRIHTDAIKDNIVPKYNLISKEQEGYIYANEAEMLNLAVFGMTAKEWKSKNQQAVLDGLNIRDLATLPQLTVLANIESYHSILIREGLPPKERLEKLKNEAVIQLKSLDKHTYSYPIESPYAIEYQQTSTFDANLKGLLNVPPPKKDINQ